MKVELRLYASLSIYMPKIDRNALMVDVVEGITIKELLDQFEVPLDLIKMIFLNGVHARGDEILNEGDRVGVFPPVAGG